MSYLLLWFEILTAFLLLATIHFAYLVRATGSLWRKLLLSVVVVGFLMFPLGALVVVTAYLAYGPHLADAAFWWSAGLWVACLIGALLLRRRAMKKDDAGMPRGASWSPRRLAETCGIVLLILFMTLWNLTLQTQIEMQALRTRAGAMALAASPPRVPDAQNAAPLYDQLDAIEKSAESPEDAKTDYERMDASSPQLVDYLQRHEKALALARRAADLAGCNGGSLDTNLLEAVLERDLSHLGEFRIAARLLSAAARREALTGHVDDAIEDCQRVHAVGTHVLGQSSMLIGGLVYVAIDGMNSRTTAEILPYVTTRGQVDRLKIEDPDVLWRTHARCLQMDEAYGLATMCDISAGEGQFRKIPPSLGALSWQVWLREDCAIYRDYMERSQQMTSEPYYKNATTRTAWEDAVAKGHRGLLSAILLPSLVSISRQVANAEALRVATLEARAATLYRLEHGSYPDAGDTLAPTYIPAIPTDPFDGKPLRYKKLPDGGVTIYSISSNGKDDGGDVERKTSGIPRDTGIVLRVASPATP